MGYVHVRVLQPCRLDLVFRVGDAQSPGVTMAPRSVILSAQLFLIAGLVSAACVKPYDDQGKSGVLHQAALGSSWTAIDNGLTITNPPATSGKNGGTSIYLIYSGARCPSGGCLV